MNKKNIQQYCLLAESRNHKLIEVSNPDTPRLGTLTIFCKTCDQQFTTSAHSYDNARKTGCPNCKAIKARSQTVSKTHIKQQKENTRKLKLSATLKKRALYSDIHNVEGLKLLLNKEKNAYSSFILNKMENPYPPEIKGLQIHHIIPKHAGGPNAQWNLIKLTPKDHLEAHKFRYEVYNQFGDYNFLSTKGVIGKSVEQNSSFEEQLKKNKQKGTKTQIKNKIGIFEEGAALNAGLRSKEAMASLTAEEKKTLLKRHAVQMSDAVYDVLYKGAVFFHEKTGTEVVLQPQEALTLTQLASILASALPEGNIDRSRLENSGKPVNLTSAIGKMIKGATDRPKAYGWKLLKDKE